MSPGIDETYQKQFLEKVQRLRHLFANIPTPTLELWESPPEHYRLRAEFRIWHEGETIFYAMFRDRKPYPVDNFPAATMPIVNLMPRLLERLTASPILRYKLFQTNFLSTLGGEVLVSLLYHRPLDPEWLRAITTLRRELCDQHPLDFVGRSRGKKYCVERDHVVERITVGGQNLSYKQVEGGFTQPNGIVNRKMLTWALHTVGRHGGDLLELYGGNGNFSLALARNFRRVLMTDVNKTSIKAARENVVQNDLTNVAVVRMSSEEMAVALAGERPFRRLARLPAYRFETVLVDPPRAGLDGATLKLLHNFPQILYISCNPETLHANIERLLATHSIRRFALFDQFPHTPHMEVGVSLTHHSLKDGATKDFLNLHQI